MDDSETYVNMKPTKTGSQAPYRDHLTSTYTELNIRLTNTQTDGLDPTYSQLNFRQHEIPIAKDEDPPIASRPGPHKQERNEKTESRPNRKICRLCIVTFVLVAIMVGLSMHVSLIRHFKGNCHRNHQAELRHQFTELEKKYRSVNETKAQICELLTGRREQAFSQDWIRNEGSCYFKSTFHISYDEAKQYCSISHSKLVEINSAEEENFVDKVVRDQGSSYWIGKCKDGKVASNVLIRMYGGDFECSKCTNDTEIKDCSQVRARFICEKSARYCPDISEKLKHLCQQPVGQT